MWNTEAKAREIASEYSRNGARYWVVPVSDKYDVCSDYGLDTFYDNIPEDALTAFRNGKERN